MIDRQRPERLHSLVGTVLPEQFFSDDREVRLIHSRLDLIIGRLQSQLSADHQDCLSVGFADRTDLIIDGISDGIARKMYFVIFNFHVCSPSLWKIPAM